jgi:phenylalanyl-tRNA synthetase beta chain
MPQINVLKKEFFAAIGKEFTDSEFFDLCFDVGVEVEIGNAVEMNMTRNDSSGQAIDISKEIVYKIEVAANRYDLLCLEGIATLFRSYLGVGENPKYSIKNNAEVLEKVIVKKEVESVRPFALGAILRNIKFDLKSYNSFIDLQDKLHQNLCRKRTLGSMGTHDYDKIQGPITYEALPPEQIKFKALKQENEMNAKELFDVLRQDNKLKKYLAIIEDSPVYPVFYDANRTVLSLPPIINSETTKITLDTKNVFIDMTGTDLTKLKVVLAVLACQFSEHCEGGNKFTVEQVEMIYEDKPELSGKSPIFDENEFDVEVSYLNSLLGLNLDLDKIKELASKCGFTHKSVSEDNKTFKVSVPVTRYDIMHPCDVVEDIGVVFGFNNIPKVLPPTNTIGTQLQMNKFTELMRHEMAQAGYYETLTFGLLSIKETYNMMRKEPDFEECVTVANPKTLEFEIVRTTLIPGLLKTLNSNKNESVPQKLFEVSDVCHRDETQETRSKNQRNIALAYLSSNSGFETVHGTLDLIMTKCGIEHGKDYKIVQSEDPMFFETRGADIFYRGTKIGKMGTLHPEVLNNFDLKYLVCVLELNLEVIYDHFKNNQ